MKIIDISTVRGRLIFKVFGIKLFTHKIMKKNLVVVIDENGKRIYNPKIKGLNVIFRGSRNIVKLYKPLPKFENVNLFLYNKSKIEIKSSKHTISNFITDLLYNSKIFIDEDFSIVGGHFISDYGATIRIGKDCMFSGSQLIKTSDGHVIYDANSKEFNKPKDVTVGNHVWCGFNTKILKGVNIPDGCVVGLNSLLTKPFDTPHCVIGGSPARILKSNIFWDRENYWKMKAEKTEEQMREKILKSI